MKQDLKEKLIINALASERLNKLNAEEREVVVKDLNKTLSYRQLEKLTGVPKSTLMLWANPKKDKRNIIHMDVEKALKFFEKYTLKETDLPKLKQIHNIIGGFLDGEN